MLHQGVAAPTKARIRAELAKKMSTKEECIAIFGLKNKFGGGRSTGFALVYDNVDAKIKYDSKVQLLRVSAKDWRVSVVSFVFVV